MTKQSYNFGTTITPLFDADGKETQFSAIKNTDLGIVYRPFSGRYVQRQYGMLVDSVRSILESERLDSKLVTFLPDNGARLYARFTLPAVRAEIPKVGDVVSARLTLKASYDGTLKDVVTGGLEVLRCTNGMVSLSKDETYAKKHCGTFDFARLREVVLNTVRNFDRHISQIAGMSDRKITVQQGSNMLENLVAAPDFTGLQARKVNEIWVHGSRSQIQAASVNRSVYGLYDSVTNYLSHSLEGQRFELSSRINERLFPRLIEASRNDSLFGELVLTPKESILN
jgi:hypothetical protein